MQKETTITISDEAFRNQNGVVVPVDLQQYINDLQWNEMCHLYMAAVKEAESAACCCEILVCSFLLFPCIFICHQCVYRSNLSSRLLQKIVIINNRMFAGYQVCEVPNAEMIGGLTFKLGKMNVVPVTATTTNNSKSPRSVAPVQYELVNHPAPPSAVASMYNSVIAGPSNSLDRMQFVPSLN